MENSPFLSNLGKELKKFKKTVGDVMIYLAFSAMYNYFRYAFNAHAQQWLLC